MREFLAFWEGYVLLKGRGRCFALDMSKSVSNTNYLKQKNTRNRIGVSYAGKSLTSPSFLSSGLTCDTKCGLAFSNTFWRLLSYIRCISAYTLSFVLLFIILQNAILRGKI